MNHKYTFWIPVKFPSLNEYVNACRTNKYKGAQMKRDIEGKIYPYIEPMPRFNTPIKIKFTWVEANKKRDFDNVAFSKKFVLDAMQKYGKLENDNRKCVVGFSDSFELGDSFGLMLEIEETEPIDRFVPFPNDF